MFIVNLVSGLKSLNVSSGSWKLHSIPIEIVLVPPKFAYSLGVIIYFSPFHTQVHYGKGPVLKIEQNL